MSAVIFFIAAIMAIAGAIGVVTLRNPFYAVLALVGHLLALAALFLLLQAQFVAAAQVVIYAGAVMVLYVFVVAYVGGDDASLGETPGALRVLAPVFAGVLFVELAVATLGSGLAAIDSRGAKVGVGYGSPGQIGELLLTRFLLPFELASILLLVAAIGAVALARRRRGLDLGDEPPDPEAYRSPRAAWTGTMAEAVGDLGGAEEEPEPERSAPSGGGW